MSYLTDRNAAPMLLNHIPPSAPLSAWVRCYRIIEFKFDTSFPIAPKMYSPRPEHCLQFYPRDTEQVTYSNAAQNISGKRVTLSGQHTILQHRSIGPDFLSVQVVFQPAGLYKLTGLPAATLTNIYTAAEDLLGSGVHLVNEALSEASSYPEMISIIERFLHTLIRKYEREKNSNSAIDSCAQRMLQTEERFSLDGFLREACLSHRQFDRLFTERIGLAPKQFLQLIRFDKTYRLKNRQPSLDWLSVAVQSGYHDYQHLSKEYKTFTGYTPTRFFLLDQSAPERSFGEAET
ncbi:MAG: AraC family transcriptional regulator [Chitinophagaceae bacterium]|nr:AraC family transcriptional regulator [Chitinophagaceae bacterium]